MEKIEICKEGYAGLETTEDIEFFTNNCMINNWGDLTRELYVRGLMGVDNAFNLPLMETAITQGLSAILWTN